MTSHIFPLHKENFQLQDKWQWVVLSGHLMWWCSLSHTQKVKQTFQITKWNIISLTSSSGQSLCSLALCCVAAICSCFWFVLILMAISLLWLFSLAVINVKTEIITFCFCVSLMRTCFTNQLVVFHQQWLLFPWYWRIFISTDSSTAWYEVCNPRQAAEERD